VSDDPDQQAVFLLRAVPFIPKIEQTQVRGVVFLLVYTALATSKSWKTAKNYSFLFLSMQGWGALGVLKQPEINMPCLCLYRVFNCWNRQAITKKHYF
jgi:hypothetical protein